MEVIEVDKLKETNNKRLSWTMPHSAQKPKTENVQKEEDDLQWKMTFDGRQPLMDADLWRKKTFVERQHSMEDNLIW